MRRRLWLFVVMATLGVALLVAAGFASPASSGTSKVAAKGGTMNLNMSATDVDFTDPSLAYGTISWQIEYATALKLYNYPDAKAPVGSQLQPEGAANFPVVSNSGKTYTITVRPGFKFSNGATVTAANYAKAINRALNKTMQSPAATFIANIVGAQDVIDGKAATASGVTAKGNKLVIKLTKPDGGMLAKLGMPFFQAIPLNLPIDAHGVDAYASAGPYYIASRNVGRQIVVKRNPNYKGKRPHNVDTFIIAANTNLDQSLLQVKSGQVAYDLGGLPPSASADLAKSFGINKGRFFVNQLVETDYLALNTTRGFANVNLRKAANNAVDRPALLRQRGAFAGKRTDQILPPGIGGFHDSKMYPLQGSNYAKAKALAGNNCGDIRLDTSTSVVGQALGQVAKYNLTQMGCKVTIKLFQGFQLYVADGTKGAPFDAAFVGWNQDYPDPYDFIDVLLNGNNIHAANNNNLAYFNVPSLNKLMDAANQKIGAARYKAYGALDLQITSKWAPWAAYDNRNTREFVSAKTGGYIFQPANAAADLNTLFIK